MWRTAELNKGMYRQNTTKEWFYGYMWHPSLLFKLSKQKLQNQQKKMSLEAVINMWGNFIHYHRIPLSCYKSMTTSYNPKMSRTRPRLCISTLMHDCQWWKRKVSSAFLINCTWFRIISCVFFWRTLYIQTNAACFKYFILKA